MKSPLWRCPHCQQALELSGRSWRCLNGHSFDCAKEGYVNLLPANAKRSKAPGDSVQMIAARRRIHQAGVYSSLAQLLLEVMALCRSDTVLDVGCGDGFYSKALNDAHASVLGIDIAKPAIKIAAKLVPAAQFAVASSFSLPLADNSVDKVLRVFAPTDNDELKRVLKPGGRYYEVTPAPQHLWQLRQRLYDKPLPHEPGRAELAGFKALMRYSHDCQVQLTTEQTLDLVAMTPFAHRGHREKRDLLRGDDGLDMQLSFSVQVFELGSL